MLVNTEAMLKAAKQGRFGIAQPNAYDSLSVRAIIKAAQSRSCPVIIGLAEAHFQYMSPEEMAAIVKFYANETDIPVALHLDHGSSYGAVIRAIRAGFTSVMMDASKMSFEDNVKTVGEIVKVAHAAGVTVEAELGHVGVGLEYEHIDAQANDLFTNPAQAVEFVSLTGIDSLAVAVGTAHGEYKGTPKLDFDRLSAIATAVDVPLVLHGGSGTGDALLSKAVACGISKVNVFTDLIKAATAKAAGAYQTMSYPDAALVGEQAIQQCLEHYFGVFGSTGHAKDIVTAKQFIVRDDFDRGGAA